MYLFLYIYFVTVNSNLFFLPKTIEEMCLKIGSKTEKVLQNN